MQSSSTLAALAGIGTALDGIDHAERRTLAHEVRLALIEQSRLALARLEALTGLLVAEADRARSSIVARGTPTTSWLQASGSSTRGEAVGLALGGRDLAERPGVCKAALAGRATVRQARAIGKVLGELPVGLSAEERGEAERILLAEAARTDADTLARLGPEVLARVAPEAAETPEAEQRRLAARARRAHARRGFSFADDGDGGYKLSGSLPHLQAAPLLKVIDARVESVRRAQRDQPGRPQEHADGIREEPTIAQRRADALCELAQTIATSETVVAPAASALAVGADPIAGHPGRPSVRPGRVAGDRPRVVVTMSFDSLRAQAEQAGVLDSGHQITAGDLRRLCCDADLTPAVLGGESEVLDFGHTVRLVPPGLRRALSLRDGGCAFPGCDVPDARCEAHHAIPWWQGGATALTNLILICPHHHTLVEPPRFWSGRSDSRWEARLDGRGLPEFVPPRSIDPTRTPRRQPRKPRAA